MGTPPRKPSHRGKTPPRQPPRRVNLTFSFQFFRQTGQFGFHKCEVGYPDALFQRFADLSSMTAAELRSNRSSALKSHDITWGETSCPDGFDHLNAAMRDQVTPWQFSVSVNKHGRVHGFWLDDTFYVVWLDPNHELYPKKV